MERFDNVRKRTRNDAAKPWKNRASTYPNSAHGSDQPVHNSSDERQEFRWAVQAGGMPANERNQLRWRHWHGRGFHKRRRNRRGQWPRQRMDRAALVVEVDEPVVVVGVGLGGMARWANMNVARYRRRFVDIKRVVVR